MPRSSTPLPAPHAPGEPPVEYGRPSKSQRKRDMTALQHVGEELVEMPRDRLKDVPLSEDLLKAVLEAQKIHDHEGRRRQIQYVGKLMRSVEIAPIQEAIDRFNGISRAQTEQMHLLEGWRERLLTDDKAVDALFSTLAPTIDATVLQQLRTTVRQARRERAQGDAPRHYRELFRSLKLILTPQSELP